jgi:hypothetical protein
MRWFEHDSNASNDKKIKHLILRHGAVGYAVYFHCLELIAGSVCENNITFELEHDCIIIADDLKIPGDGKRAGCDIVQEIMMTCIELNLFQTIGGRVFCFPMARRVDKSQIKNPQLKAVQNKIRAGELQNAINEANKLQISLNVSENHGKVLLPDQTRPDQKEIIKIEHEGIQDFSVKNGESDSKSPHEQFEDECFEDPEPIQLQHYHPCRHSELWNSLGQTPFKLIRTNISTGDIDDYRKVLEGYTFDEIQQTIRNYATLQSNPQDYQKRFQYKNLKNFLLNSGVEEYSSIEKYKLKKSTPASNKPAKPTQEPRTCGNPKCQAKENLQLTAMGQPWCHECYGWSFEFNEAI